VPATPEALRAALGAPPVTPEALRAALAALPVTPEALRAALAALPVTIEGASVEVGAVSVPSYPDGPRPTSLLALRGDGATGRAEHVGWSEAAHEAFRERALPRVPRGAWRLESWSAAVAGSIAEPYDRAALEAAAIDLALQQQPTSLFDLVGSSPRPVRYVVSFGRVADPAGEARRQGDVELKVDADPAWDDATFMALAASGRVAVLDWKNAGTRADHERAHRILPDALVEDPCWELAPWSGDLQRWLAADAPLGRADDVHRLPVRPAAANLKPARMGGLLEMLAAAAACRARGIFYYVGGMFEVGIGRRQLQALAALLCPDGPNDVASIARTGETPSRPARIEVDGATPGFGA
jgi:L-alanine-DL-glutamate epimerase-like enolase superfamily enzyme